MKSYADLSPCAAWFGNVDLAFRRARNGRLAPARVLLVAAAAILACQILSGCGGLIMKETFVPSRDGATSPLVRYAYFSLAFLKVGSIHDADLPPAYREFDSDNAANVTFVAGINNPGKDFGLRGSLKRPDGSEHGWFGKSFRVGRHSWYYFSRDFPVETLRPYPGIWLVELFIDGEPVGTFRFTLGDAANLARLKNEARTASVPLPAEVRIPSRPAVVLQDPAPGAVLVGDRARLKIEVRSESRPTSLVVTGAGVAQTLTPDAGVKPGEPWVIEATVPLAEGENVIRLEATDGRGAVGHQTVTLTRQRLVALELHGPARAAVTIGPDRHVLDASGKLVLRLAPGTYELHASKDGYLPLRQPVELSAGQKTVSRRLTMIEAVAPTITVVDPAAGTILRTATATLRIEVKARHRVTGVRVGRVGGPAPQTFVPGATARPGEAWTFEASVALGEGRNDFNIDAVDEHGMRAERLLTLSRQSLVTLELRGQPGAEVVVGGRRHALDAQGALTLDLPPGSYELEASKDGFIPSRESVTLVPGVLRVEKRLTLAPVTPPVAFGRYHALVIGNQNYARLRSLRTPHADAGAVADVLTREYRFDSVQVLKDATRSQLVRAFDALRRTLGDRDNLLIYYAGHGWLDREADRGYWLPVDAEPDSRANWLSNGDITDTLKALRAKHVVVVADSCYSGTLTRSIGVQALVRADLARLALKRARTVLTSGGLEPVSDVGGGRHSVFAKAFLEVLVDNRATADLTSLFAIIRRQVLLNAEQTPEYADIRLAGHDGGDFIFVRQP